MKARRWRTLGLACLLACRNAPALPEKPAAQPVPGSSAESAGAESVSCPRVERGARMWTGFLVDVPSEAMARALDVVVPIQVALGKTFCPRDVQDCRPSALLAIDLVDAQASEARVRVRFEREGTARELALIFHPSGGTWRVEPVSLTDYLELCRAEEPSAKPAGPRAGESKMP